MHEDHNTETTISVDTDWLVFVQAACDVHLQHAGSGQKERSHHGCHPTGRPPGDAQKHIQIRSKLAFVVLKSHMNALHLSILGFLLGRSDCHLNSLVTLDCCSA